VNQPLIDEYIDRAIEEFDTNPLSARLIRRLSNEFPELFTVAALRQLLAEKGTAAHRFVANLMIRQPSVEDEVTNPARGTKQRSLVLLRQFLAVDPSFDLQLAKKLPDRDGTNRNAAVEGAHAWRILDILDETSTGRRLLPMLAHLVDSPDAGISARATLFVGRRLQSPAWAATQLTRSDQRVRANAVESLWGLKSDRAKDLLEICALDDCNRVAGNALVGLHLLGKPGIIEMVTQMASAEKPELRATAAWSMGRIGDPGFGCLLRGLLRDEHPKVRSTAIRSLNAIRKIVEANPVEGPVEMVTAPAPVPVKVIGSSVEIDIRLDGTRTRGR
jgi:HEAT repeat protein